MNVNNNVNENATVRFSEPLDDSDFNAGQSRSQLPKSSSQRESSGINGSGFHMPDVLNNSFKNMDETQSRDIQPLVLSLLDPPTDWLAIISSEVHCYTRPNLR